MSAPACPLDCVKNLSLFYFLSHKKVSISNLILNSLQNHVPQKLLSHLIPQMFGLSGLKLNKSPVSNSELSAI